MAGHHHFTASKTTESGEVDRHRYIVADEYASAEQKVAVEMGYTVEFVPCSDDCLGRSLHRER